MASRGRRDGEAGGCRRVIVVTGTGRAGTTFFMSLCTELRLPTGFDTASYHRRVDQKSHGGLEIANVASRTDVEIFKSPALSDQIDQIHRTEVPITHVVLPVRNVQESALSRKRIGCGNGGWWDASSVDEQERHNRRMLSEAIVQCTLNDIPFTTVAFPRLTHDAKYLYERLQWLWDTYGVDYERLRDVHTRLADPQKVHSFTDAAANTRK